MPPADHQSPGEYLASQLIQAVHDTESAPLPDARDLPALDGLTARGVFTLPQENVLVTAAELIAESGRVYVYGDSVVMDSPRLDGGGARLTPLLSGSVVEVGAEDLLANLIICRHQGREFPFPRWFGELLLRSEQLPDHLPRIRHYATRPVFDDQFVLRGPGWHPQVDILVHGPEVEPTPHAAVDPHLPAIERLPPHLASLLGGFCFRADADLANTLGFLLTGILINHFVVGGKPIALIDGNQPSLGKSLLIRVIGAVVDGDDPRLIHFTADDEELQ